MKIGEAQRAYQAQRSALVQQRKKLLEQKQALEKKTSAVENGREIYADEAAKLELSLDTVEQRFDENGRVLEYLAGESALAWNAEVARQQRDTAQDYGEDMAKIMEVARRIAKGDKVPGTDEKKLMDYSMELYLSAKDMAMMNKERKRKEHDSLWEEEEEKTAYDPEGKAADAETSVSPPDMSPVEGVDTGETESAPVT